MKAARCFRAMLCLLMGLGLCGCSDDEQPLPAYVQTLADLEVGNPASRQTLVLEDGERCGLLNMLSGVRPDTMLRVCVAYTAHPDEGGLRLHACEPVFSPMPKPMAAAMGRSHWTGTARLRICAGVAGGCATQVAPYALSRPVRRWPAVHHAYLYVYPHSPLRRQPRCRPRQPGGLREYAQRMVAPPLCLLTPRFCFLAPQFC